MFDLLIFDCDGVLVDSELLARAALQAVYARSDIEVTDAMVDKAVGMKQADILALIERETGRALPQERLGEFWPVTRDLFTESLEGTAGIREFLSGTKIARCVASSSHHERIRHSLQVTGLDDHFADDAIFSSHDVKNGKPAPDLVLHAATMMGAAPERCLVIEDSRYGVIGAKAAGMTAFGFVGGSHLSPASAEDSLYSAGADFVARRWDEVAARLFSAEG
ncbi:HAD family phosphatase [Jiella sp. MQZ9-1]|uniref:HAD family phosphatase n=1 Tax=Jiella flava TaxID=2816857 RepID=A0A939G0I9_9HYPH|nr:HAD family phosphatase [Jiella flava]MBO0664141.1 HAD family phosphatase [Jiella flava]MCD2472713.1 HAD family phosphatase [Jiella flava]